MYWTLELATKLEDAPWPATKDELIDFCHQIWDNGVLQPTPGVEIPVIKAEYLKIRYRQICNEGQDYPLA